MWMKDYTTGIVFKNSQSTASDNTHISSKRTSKYTLPTFPFMTSNQNEAHISFLANLSNLQELRTYSQACKEKC